MSHMHLKSHSADGVNCPINVIIRLDDGVGEVFHFLIDFLPCLSITGRGIEIFKYNHKHLLLHLDLLAM